MALRDAEPAPTRLMISIVLALALLALVGWPCVTHETPSTGPVPPAAGTAFFGAATDPLWNNGVIQLRFATHSPSFSVVSDTDSRVAVMHALTAVAEIGPAGNLTRIAPLLGESLSWVFSSAKDPTSTVVWINGTVPVVRATGEWEAEDGFNQTSGVLGNASVSVIFYLNASTSTQSNEVRFTVNVTQWPWWNSSDNLGLEMLTVALGPTVIASGALNDQILEVRSGTDTPVSQLSWDSHASVTYAGGAQGNSSVGSFRIVSSNGMNATLRLDFGSVGGGYSSLSYDPVVRLNLSAFLTAPLAAWLISQDSLEVIGFTALAVVVLALVAWRNRSASAGNP